MKLRGCPDPQHGWRGRQQRSTGAAAAAPPGQQILASTSKARGLLGIEEEPEGASACKGDFCYQTLPRGRENSCVSV